MSTPIGEEGLAESGFEEDTINLRHYWNVINRYKWYILLLTVLVGVITLLVVAKKTPVYKSTASVMLTEQQGSVVSIKEVYATRNHRMTYLTTQIEILKSVALLEKLVDKLKLYDHPEFNRNKRSEGAKKKEQGFFSSLFSSASNAKKSNKSPTMAQRREGIARQLRGRLKVSPVKRSSVIKISFDAFDPQLAATLANSLANLFIENELEGRMEMTQRATGWLSERLKGLREQLEGSERKLQAYREKHGLVAVKGVHELETQQLQGITPQLLESRKRRIQAEKLYRQVQAVKGRSISAYEAIPSILSNPSVQMIKETEAEVERKVSELSKRYGRKHPKMRAARDDLKAVRSKLYRQIKTVVVGVSKEYELAKAAELELEQIAKGSKKQLQKISGKSFQLESLKREVDANRNLYDMFMKRMKETSTSIGLDRAHARIIDPAKPAKRAYKPKKRRAVQIAMVVTLVIGIGLAFLLDALDNTLKGPSDVEDKLGLSVLGMVHRIGKGKEERSDMLRAFVDDPQGVFAEAIRSIRTGVVLSGLDNPHKVVVVTSSVPGEGKTTLSTNLAVALGQMERVLLIDADMRRPTIRKNIGLDADAKGLSDYVAGSVELNECVHVLPGSDSVHLIPSGTIPPNPLELLSSHRFAEVLSLLEEHYDRIVIDSAPVLPVSDARVLSRYANALIYVVKADATPVGTVKQGVKLLKQASAPMVGVVLNHMIVKKGGYYGKYGENYGYAYGYGYSSENES